MSVEFILRIIGMIIVGVAGGYWGFGLPRLDAEAGLRNTMTFALVGALAGLILTPYLTTRPARALRSQLGRMAAESLFAGLLGLVIGLLIAALLAFPLSLLPKPFGQILPFVPNAGRVSKMVTVATGSGYWQKTLRPCAAASGGCGT